jgi:mono/diheme cytochrome c family protein
VRRLPVACLTLLLIIPIGCTKHSNMNPSLSSKVYGGQIVEVSGSKQSAGVGSKLADPVVVQVNGADGSALAGALVSFHGDGLVLIPTESLSDASGQVSVSVQLGGIPGSYQLVADTPKTGGGNTMIDVREIALGYQEKVGKEVSYKYCTTCHDPESTAERVSNFDNLAPPHPHQFTDGSTLNNMSDADLIKVISDGGPALGKSPQTPAYRSTLTQAQIRAVVAYIRAIADPPYQTPATKH